MGSLNREILRLALPSIFANLTVPLVGMVDIAVAGHLDSSAAALIGGVSIGSMMFDVLYWNFGFLRAGTGGLTSQAFGREDWTDCVRTLLRGLATALAISLAMIALQRPFCHLFFCFVDCSEEVRNLAVRYFTIRILCSPATMSLMVVRGWFIGMQDTFSSMVTDTVVNVANIVASIALSVGIPTLGIRGMGFEGVATGTVAAQYLGLLVASVIMLFKYSGTFSCRLSRSSLKGTFSGGKMHEFFSVNKDLFIRSLCLISVYLGFSAISARFGDVLLASCSIMMKLLMIFSYFSDGFAFAGEALTGRFVGSRDSSGLRRTVRLTFAWSMGIGLLFVGIYSLWGMPMFRLMTEDAAVLDASSAFLPWLVLIPIVGCPAFTWDGIYIGATATRQMRDSNIWCAVSFFAVWFVGRQFLSHEGNVPVHLLFAAYYTHLIVRSLYQTAFYRRAVLSRIS